MKAAQIGTISSRNTIPITLFSANFGTRPGDTSIPTTGAIGWTTAGDGGGDWLIDGSLDNGGGIPVCDVSGTSANSMLAYANSSGVLSEAITPSFSTSGMNNIVVYWNGYRSIGAPTLTFSWSPNLISWSSVTFTDVVDDGLWYALTPISLPVEANNKTNMYLKFSFVPDGSGNFIAFDDLRVTGT